MTKVVVKTPGIEGSARVPPLLGLFALKIPPDSTGNYCINIVRTHSSLPMNTIQSSRDYWKD